MFAFLMGQPIFIEPLSCEMYLLLKCLCCVDKYYIDIRAVYVCLLCKERNYKMYKYNDLLTFRIQSYEKMKKDQISIKHFIIVMCHV